MQASSLEQANHGVDLISDGLSCFDSIPDDDLKDILGPKIVDLVARLTAQESRIGKLVKPLKDKVKTDIFTTYLGIEKDQYLSKGEKYQAVIDMIEKEVFDGASAKKYLGDLSKQFMKRRREAQLRFEVVE